MMRAALMYGMHVCMYTKHIGCEAYIHIQHAKSVHTCMQAISLKHSQSLSVALLCHPCASMRALHKGQRVHHWTSLRKGEVIKWYIGPDPRAGKMWILFDDGEVELRWVGAFPPDDEDMLDAEAKSELKKRKVFDE
jgi:hypothetical protein